jgi:hypothetical protein
MTNSYYTIVKEHDINGVWFTVYVGEHPIDGYRDPKDAYLFGEWYTNSSKESTNERQSYMVGPDSNL